MMMVCNDVHAEILLLVFFPRYVNIPVLPQGLQIMADLGFGNRPPLILPARENVLNVPDLMRKYFIYIAIL